MVGSKLNGYIDIVEMTYVHLDLNSDQTMQSLVVEDQDIVRVYLHEDYHSIQGG